ncbi:MAG TPA: cation transporter [Candidatus Gemmiger excrementipullorum]|uniref:Cation transporter n=1 Tax=Candidatus Gemmiger excrementipullorum TaxID=2838610 RepID=A0A9D1XZU3_9FIRM|nr:cation transporter [Candidatus Gemmiger excrementipullorum]
MQKKYNIEVDCANCAAKIETAVKALPGVKNASVSFMAQKLLLEADDAQFQSILQQAVRAAKKIEPDFEIEL